MKPELEKFDGLPEEYFNLEKSWLFRPSKILGAYKLFARCGVPEATKDAFEFYKRMNANDASSFPFPNWLSNEIIMVLEQLINHGKKTGKTGLGGNTKILAETAKNDFLRYIAVREYVIEYKAKAEAELNTEVQKYDAQATQSISVKNACVVVAEKMYPNTGKDHSSAVHYSYFKVQQNLKNPQKAGTYYVAWKQIIEKYNLVLSRFCSGPLSRLGYILFECDWAFSSQC